MLGTRSWKRRCTGSRPVVLTAAATVLAMIPLTRSVFWGPMAIAIMGGLTIATLLTIFFVPALYAAWFNRARNRPERTRPDRASVLAVDSRGTHSENLSEPSQA